jgi:hypothetical protein
MACGKCKRNAEKFKQQQSSRMPVKNNNIKKGIQIPPVMTPNQRRVMMHKVANAPGPELLKPQIQHKRQSVEEYNARMKQELDRLALKNKKFHNNGRNP